MKHERNRIQSRAETEGKKAATFSVIDTWKKSEPGSKEEFSAGSWAVVQVPKRSVHRKVFYGPRKISRHNSTGFRLLSALNGPGVPPGTVQRKIHGSGNSFG